MLIYDDPQRVADWVAAQSGDTAPTVDSAIGYESEGELKTGVYFDGYTKSNIFAHIANTADIMPHSLIRAVAVYAFLQLKLPRMTFAVDASNKKVVQFVTKLGAYEEAYLEKACGDSDLLLYVLWSDDEYPQQILNRGST